MPQNPTLNHEKMKNHTFLEMMYNDAYFPNHLVDKGKKILVKVCEKIEHKRPETVQELYVLTHAATEEFNALNEEFYQHDSEIETAARECIADQFYILATAYGYTADIEELIAPRDW